MRFRVLAAAVLLAVAGCGTATDSGAAGPAEASRQDIAPALAGWSFFPMHAWPRPLVVIGSGVSAPSTGFPTSDAKQAWLSSAIDLPPGLPAGPGSAGGYPVMTATQAGRRLGEGPGNSSAIRLAVTGSRLSTATVATDRGPRRLPVWLFGLRGVRGEASVLAVADSARFTPDLPQENGELDEATLHRDGTTLTVRFGGAPDRPGPCGADYSVDATETETAVALTIRTQPRLDESGGREVVCDLVAYARQADVRLVRPLGQRVAVTATGAPITVTPGV